MKTREQIISDNPIDSVLESRGVHLVGGGQERKCKCPFHDDKTPSMSVNVETGLWKCWAGCGQGSVIDLVAALDGISASEALKKLSGHHEPAMTQKQRQRPIPERETAYKKIAATYSYRNARGQEVFQVVRFEPKTFRQRHKSGGSWVWGMEGVERVLYRLPELLESDTVWVVEGEKDADTLAALGFCATCNVGGAGKWLDAYSEALAGKSVIICPDNDNPGRQHAELVFKAIAGKVEATRRVDLPEGVKDVSELVAVNGADSAKETLNRLASEARAFKKGLDLPVYSLPEIESIYRDYALNLDNTVLDFSRLLPSMRWKCRGLVPGELVTILAGTGVGKTAFLQNLAIASDPLPVLMFQMELPLELMFERFISIKSGMNASQVESEYRSGEILGERWLSRIGNIHVCCESGLTLEKIEQHIQRAELKMGERPKAVFVDYVQLIQGPGRDRYERTSNIAEGLKVLAKKTKTVVVAVSQISRQKGNEDPEVGLSDGKDSGAIENSSGLVLGVWRDKKSDGKTMVVKVCKNTKGKSDTDPDHWIKANFDGPTLKITEQARDQIAAVEVGV